MAIESMHALGVGVHGVDPIQMGDGPGDDPNPARSILFYTSRIVEFFFECFNQFEKETHNNSSFLPVFTFFNLF
jgi:hypothetical protein